MTEKSLWRVEKTFYLIANEAQCFGLECARLYVVEDFPTMGGRDWWRFSPDAENTDLIAHDRLVELDRRMMDSFGDALMAIFGLMEEYAQPNRLPLVLRVNLCQNPKSGYDGSKRLEIIGALFEAFKYRSEKNRAAV